MLSHFCRFHHWIPTTQIPRPREASNTWIGRQRWSPFFGAVLSTAFPPYPLAYLRVNQQQFGGGVCDLVRCHSPVFAALSRRRGMSSQKFK